MEQLRKYLGSYKYAVLTAMNTVRSIMRSSSALEIYKCVVLTVMAFLLALIWLNTPVPFTVTNLQSERVKIEQIPMVRIQGGNIEVDNTVEIEGTVSIQR